MKLRGLLLLGWTLIAVSSCAVDDRSSLATTDPGAFTVSLPRRTAVLDIDWSPDGRLLALALLEGSTSGVWLIDEGRLRPLTKELDEVTAVAWLDDQQILVSHNSPGEGSSLATVNLDGVVENDIAVVPRARVAVGLTAVAGAQSAVGGLVASDGSSRIGRIDLHDGTLTTFDQGGTSLGHPVSLPDDGLIALAYPIPVKFAHDDDHLVLIVPNADPRRLTPPGIAVQDFDAVSRSDGGTLVVFAGFTVTASGAVSRGVWQFQVGDTGPQPVSDGNGVQGVALSSDGLRLALVRLDTRTSTESVDISVHQDG